MASAAMSELAGGATPLLSGPPELALYEPVSAHDLE